MRLLVTFLILLVGVKGFASGPSFNNLSDSDVKAIIKDFSSVMSHTSVSPASSLGAVFGFELGLVGGMTETPGVEKLSKQADPNSDINRLPHGGLLGILSFPMGFSGEVLLLPSFKSEDIEFKSNSVAGKWTFTELFPLPVDAALKLSVTKTDFEFTQTTPIAAVVDYGSTTSILSGWVSKKFTVFEPYFGMGLVRTKGKISSSEPLLFQSGNDSVSQKESGMLFTVGANFNLIFMKLGLEAGKALGVQKASAKFSFYF